MAATVKQVLNSGDKTYLHAIVIGTGAIAAGDLLITDTKTYPEGSEYFDETNRVLYKRIARSNPGVIGDWAFSAAFTIAT